MTAVSSMPPNRTNFGFLMQFLRVRKLDKPLVSQPLYTYKISEEEFITLKSILGTCREVNQYTAACFVLFAAEWWRRYYEGGHWRWEPIFNEINQPNWQSAPKTKELVELGCAFWNRSVFQHATGTKDFLGTVFFEAGLPVCLLTNEGYIRTLLLRAFTFLESNHISRGDAVELICQQALPLNLPDVLRERPFFELIHTVVSGLQNLKKTYTLEEKEQPLSYLNQYVPSWRDSLPVRLDDGPNAGAFIDALLVDVAKLPRSENSHISVTYELIGQQTNWSVSTTLTISDGLHKPENLQLTPEAFAGLSATVIVKIVHGNLEKLLGYGYKHGSDHLSIRGLTDVELPANIHGGPWQLVFAHDQEDYRLGVTLPYGEGLDPNLPWVFTPQSNSRLVLKGVGSVRLASEQAWVVCPTTFAYEGPADGAVSKGSFSAGQKVFSLESTGLLRDIVEDQFFRIRLSELYEDPYYFTLRPENNTQRINVYASLNAAIYVGFPRICKIYKSSGWRHYSADGIQYKATGSTGWQPVTNPDQLVGCFRIRVVNGEGSVLFSREIAVLPRRFTLSFQPSSQSILFTNTGGMRLSVDNQQNVAVEKEDNGYRVKLLTNNQIDGKLRVSLTGIGSKPVILVVPAQTNAGFFTDNKGKLFKSGQIIDLQQLYGARLVLNNLSSQEAIRQITLTLIDRYNPDASRIRCEMKLKVKPFSTEEVSLLGYRPAIEKLLSFTETVSATVRIEFGAGGGIQIAQYTYNTDYASQDRRLTIREDIPDTTGFSIQAFRLDTRFAPTDVIDLLIDESGWLLPPEATGTWFYYSGRSSVANIRPGVVILADKRNDNFVESVDEIHEATHLSYDDRQRVLKELFDRISCSFDNVNWTALQQLHDSTQHLPLNALDVWKALVKSERGLVSFFLLFDSLTVNKLTREFSVNWHVIPISVWLVGIRAYQLYLDIICPPAVAKMVLQAKLEEIESNFSLKCLGQIIRIQLVGELADKQFEASQKPAFISINIKMLLIGEMGNPGLVHQVQNRFPVHLYPEIIRAFGQLPAAIRDLVPLIPNYIRPVAYLPILLAYHSVVPDNKPVLAWDRHKVQQLVDFDIDYFNHIHNLIQSFCWLTLVNQ